LTTYNKDFDDDNDDDDDVYFLTDAESGFRTDTATEIVHITCVFISRKEIRLFFGAANWLSLEHKTAFTRSTLN